MRFLFLRPAGAVSLMETTLIIAINPVAITRIEGESGEPVRDISQVAMNAELPPKIAIAKP